jgi:hypothetical protein
MKKILFILLCLLLVGVAGAQTISSSTVSIYKTGTVADAITLDYAPTGLSGYNVTLTVANSSVATITGVSFPSWAVVNTYTSLPSSSVTMLALDTGNVVTPGMTNIPLATVNIQGVENGTTTLNIVVNEFDDDNGAIISTSTSAGTITVTPTPASGLPEMPTASVTLAPVDTMGYTMLHNAIGGSTQNTNESINFSGVVSSVEYPYTSTMGSVALIVMIAVPFLMLYIAQGKAWIPLIIGIILVSVLYSMGFIPAEYIMPVDVFIGLAVCGVLISVYLGRKV